MEPEEFIVVRDLRRLEGLGETARKRNLFIPQAVTVHQN